MYRTINSYGEDHDEYENTVVIVRDSQSEGWDIDVACIWVGPGGKGYSLATASGCSCWDGDYRVEDFDTLPELEQALSLEADRPYNVSPARAAVLLDGVYKWLGRA